MKFDISMTNANKGIALLLLLWHHLFYKYPEYGKIVYNTAILAKVCVAIFILLSGYGLSESAKKSSYHYSSFIKKRMTKLYLNYWVITAIFIPLGVLFMNSPFDQIFGHHEYIKLAIQLTGFHMYTAVGYGYNATWWFMSLILGLYFLFPIIHRIMQSQAVPFLIFSFLLLLIPKPHIPVLPFLQDWILPFSLGIYLSKVNGFPKMLEKLENSGSKGIFFLLILLILISIQRNSGYLLNGIKLDGFFALLIIIATSYLVLHFENLKRILGFIGMHSFNIFLFHTFIYSYYWKDFIYSFEHPLVIFSVLLSICLIVSILIEYLISRIRKCSQKIPLFITNGFT